MKLYYYQDPIGNFGDDLNQWLWPKLLPGLLDDNPDELFIGIGTILDQRIPAAPCKIVFGTGCGYGERLSLPLDDRWRVYCVRGPRTAQALGLPKSAAVTDPAVLVRSLVPRRPSCVNGVALMLHHMNPAFRFWEQLCRDEGIVFIDPRGSLETTLEALAGSRLVLAEAMHGAIVADALRIPWVPLKVSRAILSWKWHDWTQSLDLPYEPDKTLWLVGKENPRRMWHTRAKNAIKLRYNARMLRKLSGHAGFLSRDSVFHSRESRLLELLGQLSRDVRAGTYSPGRA